MTIGVGTKVSSATRQEKLNKPLTLPLCPWLRGLANARKGKKKKKGWEKKGKGWIPSFVKHAIYKKGRDMNKKKKRKIYSEREKGL